MLQERLRLFMISKGLQLREGHTGKYPWQQHVYMALGSIACVEQVCEIGFNAGHSATVWLSAKPEIKLTAFDTAHHAYVLEAARFMEEASQGRVRLIYGNSEETVPKAASGPSPHPPCDILVVDGGHSLATATADIAALRRLAAPAFNVFVIDDVFCEPRWCAGPTAALQQAVEAGHVRLLQSYVSPDKFHGFAVGTYLF